MAERVAAEIAAAERVYRRRLALLRLREQGFYFSMVAPVVLLLLVFFVVPLITMVIISFQDGPKGLPVENEVAASVPGSPTAFKVARTPLADIDGSGTVDAKDLEVHVVRPLEVVSIDPQAGKIILSQPTPEGKTIAVSYNDVGREISIRRGVEDLRVVEVKKKPIKDRNGDGRVTADDVTVVAERRVAVTAVDPTAGTVTLESPLEPGEEVLVKYNYHEPITLFHYKKGIFNDFYWNWEVWKPSIFRTTFEIAVFTTVGSILLAYPVAYLIANVSPGWRSILLPLVVIPFWTSILIRTFAWRIILGKAGLINWVLLHLGITHEPLTLVFNRLGTYVGMVHVLMPFVALPAFAVMSGIPEHPIRAAQSLGATPLRTFLRVYLPLSMPGVAAGGLLVFILALGFFITPALLGGGGDRMVSNLIEIQINTVGDWNFGAALAFILLVPTLILYLIYSRFMNLESIYGASARAAPTGPAGATTAREVAAPGFLRRFVLPGWQVWRQRVLAPLAFVREFRRSLTYRLDDLGRAIPFNFRLTVASVLALIGLLALGRWVYQVPLLMLAIVLVITAAVAGLSLVAARIWHLPPGKSVLAGVCGLIFLFLIMPNFVVIPISFTRHPVFLTFPGEGFTLENFAAYFGVAGAGHFGAGGWIEATIVSLEIAIMVVIVSVPLGSLAAYGLVRGSFPGRTLINYLIVSPLIVPILVTAIAVFMFYSKYMKFMIGSIASFGPIQIPLGFVVAHSLLAIPFVVVILTANLKGIDPLLENASMSLGASRLATLRKVVLPLMIPGMIASAFFAFLTSWDELIIAIFLSTPRVTTLPKRIWDGIRFEVDPTIAAIATMLVFTTLVMLSAAAFSQWYFAKRRGAA